MRRRTAALVVSLCLLAIGRAVWAQEVSKKKEIAVFNLSYYNWAIPAENLGRIDDNIRSVFVNLGRFSVIGMTYRLGEADVNDFIDKIKQFKSENAEIPDQVQMGQEYFTQADMNKLIASFIVVIPAVVGYSWDSDSEGKYSVKMRTSFTFVNVETQQTIAQFAVDSSGSDKKLHDAVQGAIDSIPPMLTFQVRTVPEFQLKTGVLEVHGSEILLELGKNMGVTVGDEYLVVASRVLPSGKQVSEDKGLLVVSRVDEEVSFATVLYSEGSVQMGDQLKELPRFGTEVNPYFRAVVYGGDMSFWSLAPMMTGLHVAITRGFYAFRPFIELETPIHLWSWDAGYSFPLNASIGGEYTVYLGRFVLSPRAAVGVGFDIPLSEGAEVRYTHFGGNAGLGIQYLFSRDAKLTLEGGYLMWMSADDALYAPTYSGVYAGGGFSIKF